jgi:hypothetical protein
MYMLVIRYMLWFRCGKTGNLGTFRPKCSKAQQELFKELYDVLLAGEGEGGWDLAPILCLIHRIMVLVLTTSTSVKEKIATVLEQGLLLSSLTQNGNYRSANQLTQSCSQIQRTFLSTITHAAFLGGFEKDYILQEYDTLDSGNVGENGEPVDEVADGAEAADAEDDEKELEYHPPGAGLNGVDEGGGSECRNPPASSSLDAAFEITDTVVTDQVAVDAPFDLLDDTPAGEPDPILE